MFGGEKLTDFLHSFRKTDKGFTLIEVLVAVVILGLAYVTVLQNFSISMKNITRIDRAKTKIFEDVLEFEKVTQLNTDEDVDLDALPSFIEGRIYRLVVIADESGELMTLRITRL